MFLRRLPMYVNIKPMELKHILKLYYTRKSKFYLILYYFQAKETVFHYAAKEGNVDVVTQILKGLHSGQIQLAVNKQSVDGWSPLIIASHKGHLDIVKVRSCIYTSYI